MAKLSDLTGGDKIITLEDITGKFNTKTQRQDYYEPKEEAKDGQDTNIFDPDGETTAADYSGTWDDTQELERTVTPERARRTGKRIAQVIDTGFNFVAANLIAHSDKDYKANPSDLEDIAEAWGDIAEEKQWEVSPYLQLMVLYAIVYAPLAKEAFNDRRIAEMEKRQDSHEDQIKALQNELARLKESKESGAKA